jgi:hypothetical protein
MFYDAGKQAAAIHYGLGAVAGGLGGIALQMLLDKDLRNELLQQSGGNKIHPQVIQDAAKIAPLLKQLNPATARIGIGGLPRTGKSEMASELSRHLGMQHHDADVHPFGSVPPGSVSDRYDTLLNQDPNQFDALLHMRRPGMAHGPASEALWDLHGMDEANKQQFMAAKGQAKKPTETTSLKLKPPGGFGTKSLDKSFVNKGEVLRKAAPGILGSVAGLIAAHLLKK